MQPGLRHRGGQDGGQTYAPLSTPRRAPRSMKRGPAFGAASQRASQVPSTVNSSSWGSSRRLRSLHFSSNSPAPGREVGLEAGLVRPPHRHGRDVDARRRAGRMPAQVDGPAHRVAVVLRGAVGNQVAVEDGRAQRRLAGHDLLGRDIRPIHDEIPGIAVRRGLALDVVVVDPGADCGRRAGTAACRSPASRRPAESRWWE